MFLVVLNFFVVSYSAPNTGLKVSAASESKTVTDSLQRPAAIPSTLSIKDSAALTTTYPYPFFNSGEAIKIAVYPDSSLFLNGFYNIDQNGNIDLPILGLVSVKNKTRNEFVDYLKKEYSDYLRYPNINVSTYMRVSFFGGFFRPGLYWIESRNSLWDALQIAGGVNREDGLRKIRWERDGSIVSKNITADFQAGTSLSKMGFKSGDQLCVTIKPKMLFWDSFRQDVIPVLSFSLTAMTTALTAYQTYKIITDDN